MKIESNIAMVEEWRKGMNMYIPRSWGPSLLSSSALLPFYIKKKNLRIKITLYQDEIFLYKSIYILTENFVRFIKLVRQKRIKWTHLTRAAFDEVWTMVFWNEKHGRGKGSIMWWYSNMNQCVVIFGSPLKGRQMVVMKAQSKSIHTH